jgi:hypothetical protein
MVRADEKYGTFGTTIHDQILPPYPPNAPYNVFYVAVGYETEDEAIANGDWDNIEETMDPTYDYPNDPQAGIDAFMQVYAAVEPTYEAVMVRADTGPLPAPFQGQYPLDSFGGGLPAHLPPVLAQGSVLHGKQIFYSSGWGTDLWP